METESYSDDVFVDSHPSQSGETITIEEAVIDEDAPASHPEICNDRASHQSKETDDRIADYRSNMYSNRDKDGQDIPIIESAREEEILSDFSDDDQESSN